MIKYTLNKSHQLYTTEYTVNLARVCQFITILQNRSNQSLKLSEIVPNFACFGPQIYGSAS